MSFIFYPHCAAIFERALTICALFSTFKNKMNYYFLFFFNPSEFSLTAVYRRQLFPRALPLVWRTLVLRDFRGKQR